MQQRPLDPNIMQHVQLRFEVIQKRAFFFNIIFS